MDWTYWTYVFISFQGRINRQPFWIACAILAAIEVATELLAYRIEGEPLSNIMSLESTGGDGLNNILGLAFTYPEFAIAVKRSNDRNLPPWVVGLFFAVNVALALFTMWNGAIDNENPINDIILYPFALLLLALIVELGFRRGTSGPNPHGPDPLAGRTGAT